MQQSRLMWKIQIMLACLRWLLSGTSGSRREKEEQVPPVFLLHAHFSDCPNEREHTCSKRKDDAQDNRYSQYRMQDKQRHLFKLWPCCTLS